MSDLIPQSTELWTIAWNEARVEFGRVVAWHRHHQEAWTGLTLSPVVLVNGFDRAFCVACCDGWYTRGQFETCDRASQQLEADLARATARVAAEQ